MKQFYTELVDIESIIVELDKLELSKEERLHLAKIIDSSLHNVILDAILSQLQEDDKKIFLKHLKENDHMGIWRFLKGKIDGVEKKIREAAGELKLELHKDLKNTKKL